MNRSDPDEMAAERERLLREEHEPPTDDFDSEDD